MWVLLMIIVVVRIYDFFGSSLEILVIEKIINLVNYVWVSYVCGSVIVNF